MRRAISIIICIAMIIAMYPAIPAFANEERTQSAKIDLSSYVSDMKSLVNATGNVSPSGYSQTVVSASASRELYGQGVANLIDGNDTSTSYLFFGIKAPDTAAPFVETWIMLDLQKTYTVDKLSFVTNGIGTRQGLPKDFTIQVSTDCSQWKTVYTKVGQTAISDKTYTYEFTATDARYVKLNVTAISAPVDNVGNCVRLRELSVYGIEKAGATDPEFVSIDADDPVFTYYGRWQKTDKGMRSGWGTSKMRFNFAGTKFNVLVEDAVEGATVLAQIDGASPVSSKVTDGMASFVCGPGEHEVLIMTGNSTSGKSNLTIKGIEFENGTQVKKTTSNRKTVEIIGDSISDGWFGITTSSYITDIGMGWESINIAYAGITLTDGIFNWASTSKKIGLDSMYFQANNKFDNKDSWNFPAESEPDYIYINIGTNDYGQGVSDAAFQVTYKNFLTKVRTKNPNATIFCVSPYGGFYGEAGSEQFIHAMETPIYEAVKERQLEGDQNVYYIDTAGLLTGENARNYLKDNLHPASGQFKYFADWIVPRLEKILNETSHNKQDYEHKEPNCAEEGYDIQKCSICGTHFKTPIAPTVDHVKDDSCPVCGTGAATSAKIDLSNYVSGMTSASNFAQPVVSASASYEKWGMGVAALIDNNATTRFAGISEADKEAGADFKKTWIKLDLQKVYTVDKLAFTSYVTASSQGLPKDFTIEVSVDGNKWTTVYTKTGLAAETGVNQFSFVFAATDARYVRLNVTAIGRACDMGNCVCLKELEVYGVPKKLTPVNGKLEINTDRVTVSGEYTPNMGKDNLFDGNTNTIYAAIDPDKAPGSRMDEWFQVDLQKVYTVNRIRMANRSDSVPLSGLPSVFEVMVSSDGENWKIVKSVDGISASDITEKHWLTVDFDPVAARYVRVRVHDIAVTGEASLGYAVTIRELEVHTANGKIDLSSYVANLNNWEGHPGKDSQYTYYASNYPQSVVTASCSYEKWGWGIAGLIDGIVGREAIFACRTSDSVGPIKAMNNEILVDLHGAYYLDGIRFASVKPFSMEGVPTEFKVEVSLDGITWESILTKTGITTADADADGQYYTFVLEQDKPIRYVRFVAMKVVQPASEALGYCTALSELELYGKLDSDTKIKPDGFGKIDLSQAVIRATNSYSKWGHGTGNLYNGDSSSNMFIAISEEDAVYYNMFKDEKVFENTSNEYVKIRLDGIYMIDIMRFQAQWANSGKGVPNSYTLEYSLDGETWQTALHVDSKAVSADGWYIDEFTSVQARYLRLKFHNFIEVGDLGYAAHLKELEFYGALVEKDEIDLDVPAPEPPATTTQPGGNAGENPGSSEGGMTSDQDSIDGAGNDTKGNYIVIIWVVVSLALICGAILAVMLIKKYKKAE